MMLLWSCRENVPDQVESAIYKLNKLLHIEVITEWLDKERWIL